MRRVLSLWKGEMLVSEPATSMTEIATAIAAKHGMNLDDLRFPLRTKPYVRARWETMWAIRQVRKANGEHRYSTTQIARFLQLEDHTTVLHGLKRHEELTRQAMA